MPQGTTFYGPLSLKEGGLKLFDAKLNKISAEEKMIRVEVPASAVLTLNATPFTLVPAPGAGKLTEFLGAIAMLDYAGTAYAGIAANEDLVIKYTNAAGVVVSNTLETTGFLDATSDQFRTFKAISTDLTPVPNAPLVLHLLNGEVTTGNSPLILHVSYRIHELGV
jgi:hypothetical protein